MFRCVTELKGLIIDFDSINAKLEEWTWVLQEFRCVFITSDKETEQMLKNVYDGADIYLLESYLKLFAPSEAIHEEMLKITGLKTTEIAYITGKKDFADHAMAFMSGVIWITSQPYTYEDVSVAPDLICRSLSAFQKQIQTKAQGFFGEAFFSSQRNIRGFIFPVKLGESVYLFMLGRYFASSHYMNQLHPYSSALFLNKREGGAAYGVLNDDLTYLYSRAVKSIQFHQRVDMVCAVPVRPGGLERFKGILKKIEAECGVTDISDSFICQADYPTQKNLSMYERQENVRGKFKYTGDLTGKNIVLIDDIITTGATVKECVRELKAQGADNVYVIVLGVNQKNGNYWTSEIPEVDCPKCGNAMFLLINSKTKNFFYSCFECGKTLSFEDGFELFVEQVNNEFL